MGGAFDEIVSGATFGLSDVAGLTNSQIMSKYNPVVAANNMLLGKSGLDLSGAGAIEDATAAQGMGAMNAIATQKAMFDEAKGLATPYITAGTTALDKYSKMAAKTPNVKLGKLDLPTLDEVAEMYKTLPGYQERLAEGIRARDMSASASGRLDGGGYLKELERYAQDYASNEFGNTYNQLYQNALANYQAGVDRYNAAWNTYQNKLQPYLNVANMGQQSAASVGGMAQNTGANIAQTQMAAGDALAQGAVNQLNARNQLVSNVLGVGGILAAL